jgi:hypothetical protein
MRETNNNFLPLRRESPVYLEYANQVGFARCIFATQVNTTTHANVRPHLLLGSTLGVYHGNGLRTVSNAFEQARIARMATHSAEMPGVAMSAHMLALEAQVKAEHPEYNTNVQLTAGVIAKLRAEAPADRPWRPLNHMSQAPSISFWFLPTHQNFINDGGYCVQIPRCKKCRIIQDYPIPSETTAVMNTPGRYNADLDCAEDLAHVKLRTLLPGIPLLSDDPNAPLPPPNP